MTDSQKEIMQRALRKSRTGAAPAPPPQPAPAPQVPVNPLLERARIPGQTFVLPSRGVFYTRGEVDEEVLEKGEVLLFPMVTMDEITMKTPDKLLNGTALVEVLNRCAPQIRKPLDLLAKDVDFLLICLRKISYGGEHQFTYTHSCEGAKEHSYTVPLDPLISSATRINTARAKEDYKMTLANSQVISLVPPRYWQMLKFYQALNDDALSNEQMGMEVLNLTAGMIDSADGIDDKGFIAEWVHTLPAGFIKDIGNKVGELSTWGPDLMHEIVCRDCDARVEVEISLNPINFFS